VPAFDANDCVSIANVTQRDYAAEAHHSVKDLIRECILLFLGPRDRSSVRNTAASQHSREASHDRQISAERSVMLGKRSDELKVCV